MLKGQPGLSSSDITGLELIKSLCQFFLQSTYFGRLLALNGCVKHYQHFLNFIPDAQAGHGITLFDPGP